MSSNLHRRVLEQSRVTGGGIGLPPRAPASSRNFNIRSKRGRDYSAVSWDKYFFSRNVIETKEGKNSFVVYTRGSQSSTAADADKSKLPVIVLLHGGGFSALTWSLFVADITTKVNCLAVAVDLRGHGDTVTDDDDDLSAESMAADVVDVTRRVTGGTGISVPPPVVLVGHSMGGAVAVHAALTGRIENLVGLCVIDVVEGTAMDSLTSMQSFLRSRPSEFTSVDSAIEWCVRSGQVRNVESARVSMPGQLKHIESGKCATNDISGNTHYVAKNIECQERIQEEEESGDTESVGPEATPTPIVSPYTWRIDLSNTEKHWLSWFRGMTNKFLSVPVPKLLVLAGIDRLDKDLTIGQMQGKFQMHVLSQAGHAVHEDVPDRVADVLATFMVRNQFTEPLQKFQQTFPAC